VVESQHILLGLIEGRCHEEGPTPIAIAATATIAIVVDVPDADVGDSPSQAALVEPLSAAILLRLHVIVIFTRSIYSKIAKE
jgi:hypothetical protein